MKILALDTSTEACSVAILHGENIVEEFQLAVRQHAQIILSMVDRVLQQSNLTLNQLDAIAFGRGPGSFTGLRIAASVTQGLACAANLPVIPVSSLNAIAQGAWRKHHVKNVLAMIDARMEEVYWGYYQLDGDELMQLVLSPESVTKIEDINISANHIWFGAGNGWQHTTEDFFKKYHDRIHEIDSDLYPHAQDIARLGKKLFENKHYVSAENALPVYIRNKVTNEKKS